MKIAKKKMETMMQVYEADYVLKLIEEKKELETRNEILEKGVTTLSDHIDILGKQIRRLFTLLEEKA